MCPLRRSVVLVSITLAATDTLSKHHLTHRTSVGEWCLLHEKTALLKGQIRWHTSEYQLNYHAWYCQVMPHLLCTGFWRNLPKGQGSTICIREIICLVISVRPSICLGLWDISCHPGRRKTTFKVHMSCISYSGSTQQTYLVKEFQFKHGFYGTKYNKHFKF